MSRFYVKTAAIGLVAALAGCATCERHPTACKAVAAVVVSGAVAALSHRSADRAPAMATIQPVNCGQVNCQ